MQSLNIILVRSDATHVKSDLIEYWKSQKTQNFSLGEKDLWPAIVTNISFILLVLLATLQLATGATSLFSQGVTAVVHGCSTHALGPILGEFPLSAGGVAHSVHQALPQQFWNQVPSRVLPWKDTNEQLFSVRFIEKQQSTDGLVSQPHNEMQHTSLDTGYLTHWTWFTSTHRNYTIGEYNMNMHRHMSMNLNPEIQKYTS